MKEQTAGLDIKEYVPIMSEMNANPLGWKNGVHISHITPMVGPNKIKYPMNWENEPETPVFVCSMRAIKMYYHRIFM